MNTRDDEFPGALESDHKKVRELLLEEVRAWVESLSEEERNTPHKSVAGKVFTPLEVLEHIEGSTQYGRLFVEQYSFHLIESAKSGEELNDA